MKIISDVSKWAAVRSGLGASPGFLWWLLLFGLSRAVRSLRPPLRIAVAATLHGDIGFVTAGAIGVERC